MSFALQMSGPVSTEAIRDMMLLAASPHVLEGEKINESASKAAYNWCTTDETVEEQKYFGHVSRKESNNLIKMFL